MYQDNIGFGAHGTNMFCKLSKKQNSGGYLLFQEVKPFSK